MSTNRDPTTTMPTPAARSWAPTEAAGSGPSQSGGRPGLSRGRGLPPAPPDPDGRLSPGLSRPGTRRREGRDDPTRRPMVQHHRRRQWHSRRRPSWLSTGSSPGRCRRLRWPSRNWTVPRPDERPSRLPPLKRHFTLRGTAWSHAGPPACVLARTVMPYSLCRRVGHFTMTVRAASTGPRWTLSSTSGSASGGTRRGVRNQSGCRCQAVMARDRKSVV